MTNEQPGSCPVTYNGPIRSKGCPNRERYMANILIGEATVVKVDGEINLISNFFIDVQLAEIQKNI